MNKFDFFFPEGSLNDLFNLIEEQKSPCSHVRKYLRIFAGLGLRALS